MGSPSLRDRGRGTFSVSARRHRVDGGMPTIDLLAYVAVMKFAWHLPLHRQVKMFAGQGIYLDVSTLVHWISRLAWWLKPLHASLAATILSAPKIFCDDTPLPVLDRTRKRTRIARLWSYRRLCDAYQTNVPTLGCQLQLALQRQVHRRFAFNLFNVFVLSLTDRSFLESFVQPSNLTSECRLTI
jgi:hypothetical protein